MTNIVPNYTHNIWWPIVRDTKTDELFPLLFGTIGQCYALI